MSSELVLQRLQPACAMEFDELIGLYRQAFPECERKPEAALRRMLADTSYQLLLASENGRAVGFAIVRALRCGAAALLEYMAVAPEERGRGLGRRIFLAVARVLPVPPVVLLLEVESDRAESPDRALRARRKRFYRSFGARELCHLSWIMPPVMAMPPPAMEMLVVGAAASFVRREQLRQWLTGIYVEVYEQSADDTRIGTMLAGLPEEVLLI